MMKEQRTRFFISLGIGVLFCLLAIALKWEQDYPWSQRLCDGFFVAGAMLLGYGGIVFAAGKGTFDMMGYSIKTVFHLHFSGKRATEEREDFADYRERKDTKRRSSRPYLMAGLLYLILAFVMLGLYFWGIV